MSGTPRNTICPCYEGGLEEAASFCAATNWVFEAMMPMTKIDMAAIEAARLG